MKRSSWHASCSVVSCKASQVSLHRIPASEETKAKWLDFIFRGNVPERVAKNLLVCAKHFPPDCFTNLGQYEAGLASKLYLIDGAVPSVRHTAASTSEALGRVHHVACQTDALQLCTVGTQLSITTLRPHYRSTGSHIVYENCLLECPIRQRVSDVRTRRLGTFLSMVPTQSSLENRIVSQHLEALLQGMSSFLLQCMPLVPFFFTLEKIFWAMQLEMIHYGIF